MLYIMPEEPKPLIKLLKNGPLKVSGLENFINSRGEKIETSTVETLCRCGGSKNKPFCDGTHRDNGFEDQQDPERTPGQLDLYPGKKITIRDHRGICSHAGFCTDGLPSVWKMGTEPWIDPDGASPEEIKKIIHRCPSGALSYKENKEVQSSYSDVSEIMISRDGPYCLRGHIVLEGVEIPEGVGTEHFALCRCGKSRNKPFCDGSHWYAGFKDDEALTIVAANRNDDELVENWVDVGEVSSFIIDEVAAVMAGDFKVAVIRTADGWFAFDARCPHQGGPLDEGSVEHGALHCPWHGFAFDLKNAKGIGNDFEARRLEVQESGGRLEVLVLVEKKSAWTVSHVIAETMVEWGIDTVFGMVGHSNLGMAEALRVQEKKEKISYYGIRHEGAASFACSGYAKFTGRPAACLSIAGPGATNFLTGLYDAKMDNAPVLALTGQINTQFLGPGSFQEIDLASAFQAVSQFSQTMLHTSDYSGLVSLALKNAIIQKSVAHLILPDEVQALDAGEHGPGRPLGRVSRLEITPPQQAFSYALARIARARRPVIIAGFGAKEGMPEIIELAEKLDCPVITTFKAKGAIPDAHPLAAGVLGRSGTPVAAALMNESDLLVVFGASFSQHTGIDETRPIIQVDHNRMALGKFHGVDELVWGDVKVTAALLKENLPDQKWPSQREEIARHWNHWRQEKKKRAAKDNGNGIASALIFEKLSHLLPEDAVITVDVGNNAYSFGRYFECKKQSVLISGYLGSIGFAFPAAMGVWAAKSGRKVVSISGDGGFGQYLGELNTAVKYNMEITHIVINNGELAKISKEQRDSHLGVWQTSLSNPDFAGYAKLCGAEGYKAQKAEEIDAAIKKALAAKGPSVVEIVGDSLLA